MMAEQHENGERREQDRRVTRLEEKVARVVSDVESEKATRLRISIDWASQLKALDAQWDLLFTNTIQTWRTEVEKLNETWAKSLEKLSDKHDDRLKVLEKVMYLGFGFMAALQFILKFS